jgi:hypothetical protein
MILRRIVAVELAGFSNEKPPIELPEADERLEIEPKAGDFHLRIKRWRDPCEHIVTIQEWEEVWFSKVLVGHFVRFNECISELNMQDRAKAYPAVSDCYPIYYPIQNHAIASTGCRRSMVFVKKPDDILLLKMAV